MKKRFAIAAMFTLVFGAVAAMPVSQVRASERSNTSLMNAQNPILGDYDAEIREKNPRADGFYHIDTPATIQRLVDAHVNTYYFLVWDAPSDWDDLQNEFAPAAEKAGIKIVVYLVPPSESGGTRKSYPYTTDYVAWAGAIANLSLKFENVIGWAIDDFNYNLSFFTPDYVKQMAEASHAINPNVSFMPQIYTPTLTKDFLGAYSPYIDGVIIAYRDDPYRNTQVWSSEQPQIDEASSLAKQYSLPLIWMVYTASLTATPAPPSAQYVYTTVKTGLDNVRQGKLAGVVTYLLPLEFGSNPADNQAYSGDGYLNLFVPAGVRTNPGDFASATQTIHPDGTGKYSLSFETMTKGQNLAGYHFAQVLVDNQVVWQEDVGAISEDAQWKNVQIDLSNYLSNKTSANLTFRLYEANGVSNFWKYVGFDSVSGTGFNVKDGNFEEQEGWSISHSAAGSNANGTVPNGDFGQNSPWSLSQSFPGVIPDILMYNPDRAKQAYNDVKSLYASSQIQ